MFHPSSSMWKILGLLRWGVRAEASHNYVNRHHRDMVPSWLCTETKIARKNCNLLMLPLMLSNGQTGLGHRYWGVVHVDPQALQLPPQYWPSHQTHPVRDAPQEAGGSRGAASRREAGNECPPWPHPDWGLVWNTLPRCMAKGWARCSGPEQACQLHNCYASSRLKMPVQSSES